MKIKLLKKVRKRFEIIHFPKGFYFSNEHYNYNMFRLVDNESMLLSRGDAQLISQLTTASLYGCKTFYTEKECIDHLMARIILILKDEGYDTAKRARIHQTSKKVWYNNKNN